MSKPPRYNEGMTTAILENIDDFLGLVPKGLTEEGEIRKYLWEAKVKISDSLRGESPFLSYRYDEPLSSLIRMASTQPDQWDNLVRIYFGGGVLPSQEGHHFSVRMVTRYKDMTLEQVKEAYESDSHYHYQRHRYENGSTHEEALEYVKNTHFCKFTNITVQGGFDPITRTGRRTTIRSCSCGESRKEVEVRNWTGD